MINMVRALMQKKIDNTQEQMDNVSSKTETLRKYQKEELEMKYTVTKNDFDNPFCRFNTAKE